jgi:uracil-DNA glycosylase
MLSKQSSWYQALSQVLLAPACVELNDYIQTQRQQGVEIYPASEHVFRAFDLTPLNTVKVVIIGQDPYHGEGQAHGLSFSVPEGVAMPPSLRNIFKEIVEDVYGGERIMPSSGDLSHWASQGVLLLNSVLTVESSMPNSHRNKGWEQVTDAAISAINKECEGVVFVLWGAFAQKKSALIDVKRHHILSSVHPSPLSAYRGFFGCRHFSRVNELLNDQGKADIHWFKI